MTINPKLQAEADAALAALKKGSCNKAAEASVAPENHLRDAEKTSHERHRDVLDEAQVKCDSIGTGSPIRKECMDVVEAVRRSEMSPLETACLEEVKNDLGLVAPPASPGSQGRGGVSRPERQESRGYDYGLSP